MGQTACEELHIGASYRKEEGFVKQVFELCPFFFALHRPMD